MVLALKWIFWLPCMRSDLNADQQFFSHLPARRCRALMGGTASSRTALCGLCHARSRHQQTVWPHAALAVAGGNAKRNKLLKPVACKSATSAHGKQPGRRRPEAETSSASAGTVRVARTTPPSARPAPAGRRVGSTAAGLQQSCNHLLAFGQEPLWAFSLP